MMIGEKEYEEDVAGLVLDQDLVGRLGAGTRRPVLDGLDFERDDCIERRIDDLWPVATVDRGVRQMEQKIDHAGRPCAIRQKPVKEFCCFWADAGQVRGVGEDRVEEKGAHRKQLVC